MTFTLPIQIVEPTLSSEAGHCAAGYRSMSASAQGLSFALWIDRGAHLDELNFSQCELRPYFYRRLRKLQIFWLFRRLLRRSHQMYVPTASYFDLRVCDLAAGKQLEPYQAFFYFHKLRLSAKRQAALRALALRQPHLELFGTSEEIVARLREAGFSRVHRIIPIVNDAGGTVLEATAFRHLLFAGAARADKGFSAVVDLVQLMAAQGTHLPTLIQTSGDHYGRHDEQTQQDLQRLSQVSFTGLQTVSDTLNVDQYRAQFAGSICLLPYSPAQYYDKMSSVVFDALMAGAPAITLEGTSMAPIVAQTGAGIVLPDTNPQRWLEAVLHIQQHYDAFQARARSAASQYSAGSIWEPLISGFKQGLAKSGA